MRPIQVLRARGALCVAAGLAALAVNLPSAHSASSSPPPTAAPSSPSAAAREPASTLRLNELEYLEMPGFNVMLAHDYYPESHQGGVGFIQNGRRVATNGDLRLDRTPGQWQPVPKPGKREIDRATGEVRVRMVYPDEEKNRRGFNPIEYPDLHFAYVVRVIPEPTGAAFRLVIDLESPLPAEWNGRVALILEFFPGWLFGKTYAMDGQHGIFPRQANGPGAMDARGEFQIEALAKGKKLVIAPESEAQRLTIELLAGDGLELVDGRGQHSNGWFIARTPVVAGATKRAAEWRVTASVLPDFKSAPVVQVSQVGYHPAQRKVAVVELDPRDAARPPVELLRVRDEGGLERVLSQPGQEWGRFLRYHCLQLDFTKVTQPGMYVVRYGGVQSSPFKIGADVYQRHVWQPTLEYFLPVQMCHMRVNDRYRIWHGACHLDDARMAPVNHNHFDGYLQGPSTLCRFHPGEHVPGLDAGGWHDAGDDDLRVESQVETVHGLALAREAFGVDYDNTTIDQARRVVEIHRPDGKPDILQQIEHGALHIVGGYKSLGRLYRGVITPTLRQYTILGDPVNYSDNRVFDPKSPEAKPVSDIDSGLTGAPDDRWVFTEENGRREIQVAAGLASGARVLRGFNDALADDCLRIAIELWDRAKVDRPGFRVGAAVELLLATGDRKYAEFLVSQQAAIVGAIEHSGWMVGRVLKQIDHAEFTRAVTEAVRGYRRKVDEEERATPYGLPYKPDIWGAGWGIQAFGMRQYYLHAHFPEIFPAQFMLHALDFILGCHPGENTASFVSGVGANSLTTAYGFNRGDWSHIPGGSASGTALIRPDFPELLHWPFLWQQTEYVLGGGTTDYLFLVLAADHVLNRK